ncbi:trehalose-phosphatase [Longimicrobium terrae]|uniref:Trehalose 6-phosphate phosphatase n=1 Tax=Longimicrobium terrae TaxID=1639882 RepID=A0A841GVH2_9BACT|nr:trehalose-phosphatase [Longimicrobium terrae]MBB4635315.1 trehalose 6-phosphate phosphatase [Longimicrobium terrae]MBB6069708.1 trehalose 6-phosphate phosphatase [Longimicrobium terrae]NNC31081.1 trehalose-phosphatase [Longimicrobium terrae]
MQNALERVPVWRDGWRRSGRLVLLLDFDGTLAPIVARPELAAMPERTRTALDRLMAMEGVEVAVVSGRGLADVRDRAAIPGIAYAGNHGMEIEGAGLHRIHPEAAAARPELEEVAALITAALDGIEGAFVEDKGLTLSIHYRQAADREADVRAAVHAAADGRPGLRVTAGKMVLEVRPRVEWDKGRAVLFLLEQMQPPAGTPILYLGDDRTDEDAFRALDGWSPEAEGVLIADPLPNESAAKSRLHEPADVGALFEALAEDQGIGNRE